MADIYSALSVCVVVFTFVCSKLYTYNAYNFARRLHCSSLHHLHFFTPVCLLQSACRSARAHALTHAYQAVMADTENPGVLSRVRLALLGHSLVSLAKHIHVQPTNRARESCVLCGERAMLCIRSCSVKSPMATFDREQTKDHANKTASSSHTRCSSLSHFHAFQNMPQCSSHLGQENDVRMVCGGRRIASDRTVQRQRFGCIIIDQPSITTCHF